MSSFTLSPPAVPDYATCKDYWLRMAALLEKAGNAQELAAALLADTAAPYHSFDAYWISVSARDMGDALGELVLDAVRRERDAAKWGAA